MIGQRVLSELIGCTHPDEAVDSHDVPQLFQFCKRCGATRLWETEERFPYRSTPGKWQVPFLIQTMTSNAHDLKRAEDAIEVPYHLTACARCCALYKLLIRAYGPDRGAEYDADADQRHLCDLCGVTACGAYGCKCEDVLCPHGRQNLRARHLA
jgi:hypothetical protein